MKHILTTNISPSGLLDTDAAGKALLLHCTTTPPDMGVSPAELLFGRTITDHMPKPIRLKRNRRFLRQVSDTTRNTLNDEETDVAAPPAVEKPVERESIPFRKPPSSPLPPVGEIPSKPGTGEEKQLPDVCKELRRSTRERRPHNAVGT